VSVTLAPKAVTDEQPQPSFRGYIATSPRELANAARQHIRTHGGVPFGFLRTEIEQSWRRSLRLGVDYHKPLHQCDMVCDDPTEVLQQNELLIRNAQPELDSLHHHFGNNATIILCSPDAHIIEARGGALADVPGLANRLQPGVIWQEGQFGTNALGTAIIERDTLHIHPGEHYLESLSAFSCTSSPVFGARGELMGVLDLTRSGKNSQAMDVIGLLKFSVHAIENRLFLRQLQGYTVIAFHNRQHYLRSAWQGLLAVDDNGRILAVNQTGCQLLKQTRERLLETRLEQLFQLPLEKILQQAHQGIGQRRTPSGKLYFELISTLNLPVIQSVAAHTPVQKQQTTAAAQAQEPALQRSFTMAARAIEHAIPVLLQGETGTGKEVAARRLHQDSGRSQRAFVAVNCAAIPENLLESELFGYREGAFTGAKKGGMKGRFEQANGGTLFLDEIGDMPLDMQARLLRVLQERRVQPLGAGEEVELDVQIIAATHCELKKMVADGSFREDLYYRLNGISITLPPLRERSDFDALICQVISDLCAAQKRTPVSVEAGLQQRFKRYHWPGNVRQLHMVLQVALAFMEPDETCLSDEHLTPDFIQELVQTAAAPARGGLLQENEASLIRQALDQHDGNVSAAASSLGISRATLYRRMKDLGND